MGRSIRTLLIWLLVLAVPTQAAAAVTMVLCGPSHHRNTHAGTAAQAESKHAHHGASAEASHAHRHSSAAMQADRGTATSVADTAPVKTTHADSSKCSACASCCSAAAILNTVPDMVAPDVSPTVFGTVVVTVDAFAADGPDRPPRTALA